MKHATRRAFIAALLALAVSSFPIVRAQTPTRPLRVLFVGNSYTYFNNLPDMFLKLAEAGHERVEAGMVAAGGSTLRDHWDKGQARKVLHEMKWDYVVLQEQSLLGTGTVVDGQARVGSDGPFLESAARWATEVRAAGARPAFYLTWARKATPDDQAVLNEAYVRAGRANRAMVVPVGIAWNEVRRRNRGIQLFRDDGSHPMPAGTYLAACTFFAAIFDRTPVGLPARLVGRPVDPETGLVQADKTAVLVDLPAADAAALQDAAWSAWRSLK